MEFSIPTLCSSLDSRDIVPVSQKVQRPTMNGQTTSHAGPSRPTPRQTSPDLLGSSPDFGGFESAPPSRPTSRAKPTFQSDDLLGDYDDGGIEVPHTHIQLHPNGSIRTTSNVNTRIHDPWDDPPVLIHDHGPGYHHKGHTGPPPIHVPLPPRPDEMPADYIPPIRAPRRMSQSFAGPSSPPLISDAGRDIVFHATRPALTQSPPSRRSDWGHGSTDPTSTSRLTIPSVRKAPNMFPSSSCATRMLPDPR